MSSEPDPRVARQQSTSHILKTGKRGNPFVKDTHDLFSTLVASLQLATNSRFFRSYPNSFTTDDAAANLSSLRFSQSNRSSDPTDPSRIVTTTTTTTFSMNRDIAKGICQHFMDARLISNAADPLNPTFKERGIYQLTPKGLHILERFITKNGIHADHLVKVFTSQPICMKLLHLERRVADDDIHITPHVVSVVFRRFSGGRSPNYLVNSSDSTNAAVAKGSLDAARPGAGSDRSMGVELQDARERGPNNATVVVKQVFQSTAAVDWLVDFSTCCCREEAAELLAHFLRYGLIQLHVDRSKAGDKVVEVQARAPTGEASGKAETEAEFRYGPKVTYRITDEGRRVSGLDQLPELKRDLGKDTDSVSNHSNDRDETALAGGTSLANVESQIVGLQQPLRDIFRDPGDASAWSKDSTSSTARLKAILDEPALRSLFREYLRAHICEENLHYWIDVQEFRRRFATSSSAVGVTQAKKSKLAGQASSAMEQHQEKLVGTALLIFNTYLVPLSPSELNIEYHLRSDVIAYMAKAVEEAKSTPGVGAVDPDYLPALRATQVQALLQYYERIADHIYRLMATDQVPRFIRTEKFQEILANSCNEDSRYEHPPTPLTVTRSSGPMQG